MKRFLVKIHYTTQVAFDYIVDAEDDEAALDRIDDEHLTPFRLEIDDNTLRLMNSDPIEVNEITNDGTTTPAFWDCECETNYVHSKTIPMCGACDTTSDEQPDSRLYELPDAFIIKQDGCPRPIPFTGERE